MSFTPYTRDKQHINISEFAFDVIEQDKVAYGTDSNSAILNLIFENFYADADASISIRLEEERERLEQMFESIEDSCVKLKIINKLLEEKENDLTRAISRYEKGVGLKFRIRNENYDYLVGDDCNEEIFYNDRIGAYFKAVIEEYAVKPYVKREKILYKSVVASVKDCVEKGRRANLTIIGGKKFEVSPYGILTDPMQVYNYIVCYSHITDEEGKTQRCPCSFRLSNIKKIKKLESKNSVFHALSDINKAAKNDIETTIANSGVQFMLGSPSKIKVMLTEKGKQKYNSQRYIRPDYIRIDSDGAYVFNCTPVQAEYYFFKFGKDARIIEPEWLLEKALAYYNEAAEQYSN